MIAFVILAVVLALVLEKLLVGKDLDVIEADHRPDVRVAEPGEEFRIRVTLKNKSRRFVPFLRYRETFEGAICPAEESKAVASGGRGEQAVVFTTWLRPRQTVKYAIPVTVSRRGRYILREGKLSCGDFLGLKEWTRSCGQFREVVAAPKAVPMEPLAEMFGGFMGEMSVNRFIMEDPVLTLGYREYTGREPMKMISWTQSAKGAGLMVKKYDYTLEPTVSVLLNIDTGEEPKEELLESCYSLARTVCAMLEQRGVKYDFTSNSVLAGAPSEPTGEGLGQRHFYGVLEHLGRATNQHNLTMEQLLSKEAARGTAAGRILITPGEGAEPVRAMNRLREAAGGNLLVIRGTEVGQW